MKKLWSFISIVVPKKSEWVFFPVLMIVFVVGIYNSNHSDNNDASNRSNINNNNINNSSSNSNNDKNNNNKKSNNHSSSNIGSITSNCIY